MAGQQEAIAARGAKKRILFLPVAMRGHVYPMMRLAKHFVARGDHEVHCWIGGRYKDLAPVGAIVHDDFMMADVDKEAEKQAGFWLNCQRAPDWHSSIAAMMGGFADMIAEVSMIPDAVKVVQRVSPDIVVADMGYDLDGLFAGFCAREGAKYWVLTCPARPEAFQRPGCILPIMFKNWGLFWDLVPKMAQFQKRVAEATGPAGKGADLGTRIFPGDRSCLQDAPGGREVCVGPFLPVPTLRKSGEAVRGAHPELAAWMDASPDPIVLVCFGTMVAPEEGLVLRLAEGLRSGSAKWRVLWSLPGEQQVHLPSDMRPSGRDGRWRVETSVPQAEVLRHERVRCFLSHCGQNSTHEGLVCGVPFVCMPFFCDQYEWADAICNHCQAGIQVDKLRSTPSELADAVAAVIAEGSAHQVRAEACAERILQARLRADEELGGAVGEGGCMGVVVAAALIAGEITRKQVEKIQRPLGATSSLLSCWAPR
mmetsp:Transcript_25380/g.67104  ORF Transcript_25380/g.67104 Transcript_25380/m.67104 type:complete len:482 (-) Transcript_25380:52-1497(-)